MSSPPAADSSSSPHYTSHATPERIDAVSSASAGALLHSLRVSAILFTSTVGNPPTFSRDNIPEWVSWHRRLEAVLVRRFSLEAGVAC